ncbi:High-affinity choline transport protein [Pseudovibrio sp. W64]|nr:High-affinity choline transport protein [Pseudovibrio sp. W64]KZL02326.1 High-affinity choline transport protein [Pseudovibrio sp. W74]KZL08130.1 High-affinity choline transport protein [Pseudovibrio sp. Ad14]
MKNAVLVTRASFFCIFRRLLKHVMRIKHKFNPPVFISSISLIFLLLITAVIWPEGSQRFYSNIQDWIETNTGWLYILAVAIFLLFILFIMVSRFGDIKLGPDHAEPDYAYKSWFAMLFSAGMGIGLVFFGVAEPIMHFMSPPDMEGQTIEAAREAMKITMFHWGLHAWAIYGVVALSLAYFTYRHQLPLLPRSALYPLFGEKIYGPIGHAVDTFAVLGTLFGVSTSLGYGAFQVNAGLNYLFDVPVSTTSQIILIVLISSMATASVFSGLDRGVKRLSETNLILAVCIMVLVLIVGPTVTLLQTVVQNAGAYMGDLIHKTFNLYAYDRKDDWLGGWTLLYWGWWISWSPFVGTFIARVSRGRSIREFLVGLLFVPTGFSLIWFTIFGNTGIDLILNGGADSLAEAVSTDVSLALFKFFEYMPFSSVLSMLGVVLVVVFFVTSSDSGSLVIDSLTSGGDINSPVWQRVFWAVLQGAVAIVLLSAGGLGALQTATIASALPFLIVMLLMCFGLYKALQDDALRTKNLQMHHTTVQYTKSTVDWRQRIGTLTENATLKDARHFMGTIGKPALEKVQAEFETRGFKATLTGTKNYRLTIEQSEETVFVYGLRKRYFTTALAIGPGHLIDEDENEDETEEEGTNYYRVEVFLAQGGQEYDVLGYTEEQLIADVVTQYERFMQYLHLSQSELL